VLLKVLRNIPPPNPFKQLTTKEIQDEINDLKLQIHTLKTNLAEVKTDTLELKTKLALIEINKENSSPQPIDTNNKDIEEEEIPDKQFFQVISKVTTQKWHCIIDIRVEDFGF